MITKPRLITSLSSIALVACLAHAGPNAHAQSYSLLDLGALPEKKVATSTPAAINNQGQVAGTSGGEENNSAFRYDRTGKSGIENVGDLPFNNISRGFGISSSGQVVGDSTFGGNELVSRAAIFSNGSASELSTGNGTSDFSRANSINSYGQVVGFSGPKLDGDLSRAFIWSKSTGMLDLGTLGGAYAQAFAINDAGFITGNSETSNGRQIGSRHAFLYNPSGKEVNQMLDLGTLGGASSYGTFINASNHVVGYSTINNSDNRIHAFLYDGKMRDLGSISGAAPGDSFAMGVNASDQVVGYLDFSTERVYNPDPSSPRVAFVYSQGVMSDLNRLIGSAAKTYRLDSATAINDKGEIVANAMDRDTGLFHAVLLTPTNGRASKR